MWSDPIIEDLHKTRDRISREHGGDLHEIFEAARRGELTKDSTTPAGKVLDAKDQGGRLLGVSFHARLTIPSRKPQEPLNQQGSDSIVSMKSEITHPLQVATSEVF